MWKTQPAFGSDANGFRNLGGGDELTHELKVVLLLQHVPFISRNLKRLGVKLTSCKGAAKMEKGSSSWQRRRQP
jgi:hypothetical protein